MTTSGKPIPLKPTKAALQEITRDRAKDSANIIPTRHAFERMAQRGISFQETLTILRTGFIDVEPELSEHGDWVVQMERRMPGGRDAVVVTAVQKAGRLIVITVEWRDL